MDQRIEAFLIDVLALAGEEPDAVREGVRVALADCEAIFRAQEPNKRMKDGAAHACRALCRARVLEEMQGRRGTQIAERLKRVLNIIDRLGRWASACRGLVAPSQCGIAKGVIAGAHVALHRFFGDCTERPRSGRLISS